jgi:fimbrial chaperone protein
MLRWPLAIIGAFCAVAVYGQQSGNQDTGAISDSVPAINITPLRVELPSKTQSQQMQVRNDADEPISVQIRIFSWSQPDGIDQYAPSTDVVVSPSITRIAPHQTQVLRLLRSGDATGQGEARFRIIIDQLPGPKSGDARQSQTRLRFSVPLFVGRDTATPAKLQWALIGRTLRIANDGGKTAKISALSIIKPDGARAPLPGNGPRYVLGGSYVLWNLNSDYGCGAEPLKIAAMVDQQTIDATPTQSCP